MSLSVAFKRLTCTTARLQAVGQHGPGHSCLIGVQVPGMSNFPKERKPHHNGKCWNIDDIIYTCNRPASASKLCPKQPKNAHIFSDCFLPVAGAACRANNVLQMVIRPAQPQHPVPAPSDLQGTLPFQSPCTHLGCTAQSFPHFFFKKWKDMMCQTCSLMVLCTFNSTKLASVQFWAVYALANNQSHSPPKTDMQGAQQVCKEFVKWWFCIISFIN